MRSLGIFGLGLLLGGLLGYALYRPRGLAASRETSERQPRLSQSAASAKDSASAQQKSEDEKVLLGDIAAVPFQELYETLSRQSPEEIARLAEQLDNLPRNPQNEARIRPFSRLGRTSIRRPPSRARLLCIRLRPEPPPSVPR